MVSDGTWTYTWEHGRQLAGMSDGTTTWDYTYDADGLRTKRTDGDTTYEYVYYDGLLQCMFVNGTPLYFTYTPDGAPMGVVYQKAVYFYVTNLQGDVVALVRPSGEEVVRYTYDAWGNVLSVTGNRANAIGAINPIRYRGYVYDQETGLYYLQSRYYNPEIGRFINADGQINDDIIGSNLFAYCGNNPTTRLDDSGKGWWVAASAIVGGIAGFTGKVISNISTGKKWNSGVIGATVGGAVYGGVLAATGNFALAGFTSAAAEAGVNEILSYTPLAEYNGTSKKDITTTNAIESIANVVANTAINGLSITITGAVAGIISPTNNGWFQPQKFTSSFFGKYAIKSQIQTAVQTVMLTGVEIVKHGMDVIFTQGQRPIAKIFP